ncbi:MAG: DUF2079 domain-containing protein [Micromonosporaceae bacterium]|nr:DUF2079 domain-containing protein [Micromonosporaceae bacterium]
MTGTARAARRRRLSRVDLLVAAACLAGALYLTSGLWLEPTHREVARNWSDQALFEWLLGYQAHALTHLQNPLWTTLLNVPDGVNLAVNTSTILVGTLLAPVTLTLGAPVSFALVLTLNLALTPYAWYHLLSRHLVRRPAAAVVGGLFSGFAPGIVSHANGHLNFTGQFLVPFIVWRLLRLAGVPDRGGDPPGRGWRDGVILGLLVTAEYSIGAEMLFFVAFGCALLVLFLALYRRAAARAAAPRFLRGLGVATVVAAVPLGYPLWMQFAGPRRYHGIGFDQRIHSEDLASLVAFPHQSLAGAAGAWVKLAANLTEETTFFGPVLLALAVLSAVKLWHRVEVRALALTAIVVAVLALGPRLHIGGPSTPIPLPYALLRHLPVFDSALPARLDLLLIPIVGVLLAFAVERILAAPPTRVATRRLLAAAAALALLPILPLPVPTADRDPVPQFFSDGTWRRYIHSGQTLVPVPLPLDVLPDGQRWQTATHFGFAIPAGFFLGPGPDGRSQIGPIPRPTMALLMNIALTGAQPVITAADREQARIDLAYWKAGLIVLSDGGAGSCWTPYRGQLLRAATALFGPPQRVEDVWLWRVPASLTRAPAPAG